MPCLSKVFNSVLNNRLQTFFDINNTIDQSQIGFQPKIMSEFLATVNP